MNRIEVGAQCIIRYEGDGEGKISYSNEVSFFSGGSFSLVKQIGDGSIDTSYPVAYTIPVTYNIQLSGIQGLNLMDYIGLVIQDTLFTGIDEDISFSLGEIQVSINGGTWTTLVHTPGSDEILIPISLLSELVAGDAMQMRVRTTVTYEQSIQAPSSFQAPEYVAFVPVSMQQSLQPSCVVKGGGKIVEGILLLSRTYSPSEGSIYKGQIITHTIKACNTSTNSLYQVTIPEGAYQINLDEAESFEAWLHGGSEFEISGLLIHNTSDIVIPSASIFELIYTTIYH